MFTDLIHNSSTTEKIRLFAWFVLALYMLVKLSFWLFDIRNDSLIENQCRLGGGAKTQMFVVVNGEVIDICLRN
jgi:hypothetical protein